MRRTYSKVLCYWTVTVSFYSSRFGSVFFANSWPKLGCPSAIQRDNNIAHSTDNYYKGSCLLFLFLVGFIRTMTGVHPCSKAGCEPDEECQVDEKGMPQCLCKGPCPPIHRPVCGSDQLTYSSNCELERESCLQKRSIKLLYEGVCGKFATVLAATVCLILKLGPLGGTFVIFKLTFYLKSRAGKPPTHLVLAAPWAGTVMYEGQGRG